MDYTIDAQNKKLGRIASEIALILQDKNKPTYERRLSGTNKVVVKNIKLLNVSSKKFDAKKYYRHTGPLGHLKKTKFHQKFEKNPAWVLHHAVRLMLPKNRLQKSRLKRLIIEN